MLIRPACALLLITSCLGAPAQAQLGDLGKAGAGILGGVLPDVGTVGVGNATGLLSYCLKNRLLSSLPGAAQTTQDDLAPSAILGALTRKKGVKTSPSYLAGNKGILQADGGTLPIGGLGSQVKGKLCELVLSRAKDFL